MYFSQEHRQNGSFWGAVFQEITTKNSVSCDVERQQQCLVMQYVCSLHREDIAMMYFDIMNDIEHVYDMQSWRIMTF